VEGVSLSLLTEPFLYFSCQGHWFGDKKDNTWDKRDKRDKRDNILDKLGTNGKKLDKLECTDILLYIKNINIHVVVLE
jgi:hypothetical protein